jgi:DNA-binding transcriptional regulator GbsR (MarR family)
MGSQWGINASTARIHALLMAAEDNLSLDEIATQLNISRGNASMCLKELRNWGVVRLVKLGGDRRDYYVCEPDVWKMFFAIGRERKRRELDPATGAARRILEEIDATSAAGQRIHQLAELLTSLSRIADRIFDDPEKARFLISFLSEGKDPPAL